MNLLAFVLVRHFGLACAAALLFLVGALLALVAVRTGSTRLTRLPLCLFFMVRRLLGTNPGMKRLWFVIFGFNGTAMLLYMASGVRPVIPAIICVATGYNVAVILLVAGRTEALDGLSISPHGCRPPPRWVALLCGLAVPLLELPCFWYSIAMGIRLGQEVAAGRFGYLQGIVPRIHAYLLLILPVLFVSAVCEAIAIRGMSDSPPRGDRPPRGSGVGDQRSGHPL